MLAPMQLTVMGKRLALVEILTGMPMRAGSN
jgi:hypothetical protein